ncbi:hypothetical protein DB44_HE00020, partial [Candidatus Protochlamydia amoebophila]
NNDPDRQTMRIHGKMQFCIEPPFVRLMICDSNRQLKALPI